MESKERAFMNQQCLSIIGIDRHIKFVGIIDQNARLLVGKCRSAQPSNLITDKSTDSNIIITSSKRIHLTRKNMYLFYSNYLLSTIGRCCTYSDGDKNNNDFYISKCGSKNKEMTYFEVSGDRECSVKLAVTPLDIYTHTFLCIYFEPAYKIVDSFRGIERRFQHMLSKITTKINQTL